MGASILGLVLTPSYAQIGIAAPILLVIFRLVQGFALTAWLTRAELDAWGWRAAFLIGTAVVPVGLYMRSNLPETMHDADRRLTTAERRRVPMRVIVLVLLLMTAATTYLYGLDYITTYAQDSLHMTPSLAFGATVVIGLCAVVADPVSGLLSDRIGRRPVMLGAVVILVLLLVPAYRG